MFYTELHGLRGLAVLLVCLFHFFEHWFPGGFRGVDVFFVLSGYLVTYSSVHSFSKSKMKDFLLGFYSRRFARIFPSLILISFLSLLLALVFTLPTEGSNVVMNYFVANLGLLNIRLFNENLNYFNLEQSLNFFTQTWSLGVEEQFYLVFSLAFLIFIFGVKNSRYLFYTILLISLLSFSLNFLSNDHSARFYLLQFRYWEIGLGSVLYFINGQDYKGKKFLDYLFLILLVSNLFIPSQNSEFLVTLIITVIPTSYFILTKGTVHSRIRGLLELKALQSVATYSYTLYLIHWPIAVFLNYISDFNFLLALGGFILSLLLSYFLYFSYEVKALQFFKKREKVSVVCLISWLMVSVCGYYVAKNIKFLTPQVFPLLIKDQVQNTIRDYKCYAAAKKYKNPLQECLHRSVDKKIVYLLGDSQSSALFPAFDELFGDKLRHIVLKATGGGHRDDIFSKFAHYDDVHKLGVFDFILNEAQSGDYIFITFSPKKTRLSKLTEINEIARLWNYYFEKLSQKGVKIVFMKALPLFDYPSVNSCAFHFDVLNNSEFCKSEREKLLEKRKNNDVFFSKLKFIDFSFDLFDFFCDQNVCSPFYQGIFIFSDDNHLTKKGSLELVRDLKKVLLDKGFDSSFWLDN